VVTAFVVRGPPCHDEGCMSLWLKIPSEPKLLAAKTIPNVASAMPEKCVLCEVRTPHVRLLCGHKCACETCWVTLVNSADFRGCPLCLKIPDQTVLDNAIEGGKRVIHTGYVSDSSSAGSNKTYKDMSDYKALGDPKKCESCDGPGEVKFICSGVHRHFYMLCAGCAGGWMCKVCLKCKSDPVVYQ
jgi:hypothetical protein